MTENLITKTDELPTVSTRQVFSLAVGMYSGKIYEVFMNTKRNNAQKVIQHYYKTMYYASRHYDKMHKAIEKAPNKQLSQVNIDLSAGQTKENDFNLPGIVEHGVTFVQVGNKDDFLFPLEPLKIQKVLVPARNKEEYNAGKSYIRQLYLDDTKWFAKQMGCRGYNGLNSTYKINGKKM